MSVTNTEGKPFVVLRGLKAGNVFWSDSRKGDDDSKLADGTVAYEIIQYCDTVDEAKEVWDRYFTGASF